MLTCRPKADEKELQIALECDPELSARLDADLLQHAAVNLLDNAVKYSPPHSRVLIRVYRAGREIRLDFQDEGIGIAEKHIPRLFERFYRVDDARSRRMGGTGLGLAIVKHIALAHGGRVSVQSAQGKGSTFSLHLPL